MDSRWFAGCNSDEEREEVKKIVLQNKKVLDILSKICYNICIGKERVSEVDYDSPSWSHKQAHNNGYLEAVKSIERLVTITK